MFESRGNFDNLDKWLKKVSNADASGALSQIAREGERSLASKTPKSTGETSTGWKGEVTSKGGVSEVAWKNHAHSDLRVNLALLIELGHGTGTGGYVPPVPYIKGAMDSVWKTAGDKIAKELVK